jgi:NADPH:quinone reductase-like Zn-dependent oxidoreductase
MLILHQTMRALAAGTVGQWNHVLMETDIPPPVRVVVAAAAGCDTTCTPENSPDAPPSLTRHQVLIRVVYADLNPVDLQKVNQPRPTSSSSSSSLFIPGFGGSGIVERVGTTDKDNHEQVISSNESSIETKIQPGDAVVFLTATGGAYAEYIVADRRAVAKVTVSQPLSLADASIVPLAGVTAYEALVKLRLLIPPTYSLATNIATTTATIPNNAIANGAAAPRRLLIVGGAGGVGSWATVLAKSYWQHRPNKDENSTNETQGQLEIICTASSRASREWCRQLGADQVIGHDEIATALPGGPNGSVDAILCLTEPTPTLFQSLADVIRPYCTICLVVAGPSIQSLNAGFLFFKGVNLVMETVFTSFRTHFESGSLSGLPLPSVILSEILQCIVSGKLSRLPVSPHPQNGCDWSQAMDSGGVLEALASGHTQGNLCMKIGNQD